MDWSAKHKEHSTATTSAAKITHPRERPPQGLRFRPCCGRLLQLTEWQRSSYSTILVKTVLEIQPLKCQGNLRADTLLQSCPTEVQVKLLAIELQKPSAGESNVSWRSLPSKHTRMRKQKQFAPAVCFQCPLMTKFSPARKNI